MTTDEQLEALRAMKLDDVKAYYREAYGASHGELAVIGDFDKDAVAKTVDETLTGWNSRLPYARILDANVDRPAMRKAIDTPDKENGFYTARLNVDMASDDPDYPALEIANFIFGDGGLKSRLMDRIRQKDGLSYGGGSGLAVSDIDRASHFSISAIAAPSNLKKLEAAIRAR